jgi:hypothetical protein
MTKVEMFLKVAQPDENGKTKLWLYSELETKFPGVEFQTKNGGDWCRSDGQLKNYIIHREKIKNKTIGIRLDGFREETIQKSIRNDIKLAIKKQKCCVTDVGGEFIECDHKNGRYDEKLYAKVEDQKIDDFQPLHRNVNLSKRTHCKKCEESNFRYDATKLGYSQGWVHGNHIFNGTCIGCYWNDPKYFNKKISESFIILNQIEN